MKKFLTILLSVVLCLSLAMAIGCGKDDGDYEVTAEEFTTAISFANESNYKITAVNTENNGDGSTTVQTITLEREGGKIKMVMVDPEETETVYLEKTAEECFVYTEVNDSFVKAEVQPTYFDMYASCNIANMGFTLEGFTYDAEVKGYTAASIEVQSATYTNVVFKFENNKLVSFSASMSFGEYGGAQQVSTVTYGGASVTLPVVA